MNFTNATMRPGRVVEVLGGGKIRASVPGLFNKQDGTNLPILSQFTMGGGSNTFSSPNLCDEIWVLNDPSNPEALFWFRKDKSDSKNFEEAGIDVSGSKHVEILCNRETDTGWATIMFSNGTGWIIRNDEVIMSIGKDGDIIMTNGSPNRTISITEKCISLGTEGKSAHPAAYGDKIEQALDKIALLLKTIRTLCQPITLLSPLVASIGAIPEEIESLSEEISSTNVYID